MTFVKENDLIHLNGKNVLNLRVINKNFLLIKKYFVII